MNSDKYIGLDVMNPGDAKLGQFYNMVRLAFPQA